MKKQIRQYGPDSPEDLGGGIADSQGTGSADGDAVPDQYNKVGNAGNSDEGESGVDRRPKNEGSLTGTDKDETDSGENMATES